MSVSVLQSAYQDASASQATSTLAFSSNTTAGSALEVYTFANFTSVSGVTDTQGNTYVAAGSAGTNQLLQRWVAVNTVGGANSVTATWGGATPIRPLFIAEIGGCTAAPKDGSAGQEQATPTTGTDASTTGSFSTTAQPALLTGLSVRVFSVNVPSAGTGFSGLTCDWSPSSGSGAVYESKRVTATGSQAVTFTATNNGQTLTVGGAFDEATVTTRSRLTLLGCG